MKAYIDKQHVASTLPPEDRPKKLKSRIYLPLNKIKLQEDEKT